ncbi:MAG: HlyD family secretion protein [bacterium]
MDTPEPKPKSVSIWIPILVISFFLVVILIAYFWLAHKSDLNKTIVTAPKGTVYLAEGTVEATEISISSKIPGRILKVNVDEGDMVQSGEVLATLESEEITAKVHQAEAGVTTSSDQLQQAMLAVQLEEKRATDQINQAKAGVDAAKAKYEMAMNGARPQEIQQAEQAVEAAKAQLEIADKTWSRMKSLADEGVIPRQKSDEVESAYKAAVAQYTAAEAKLKLVKEGARKEEKDAAYAGLQAADAQLDLAKHAQMQVAIRKQDVAALRAKLQASQALLDEANSYLNQTEIKAPTAGLISQKIAEPGEMVAAGYPILTLVDQSKYWIEIYVNESLAGGYKSGDAVTVELPAINKQVPAHISKIVPAADFATKRATNERGSFDIRTFQFRIEFDQSTPDLIRGMTARVFAGKRTS